MNIFGIGNYRGNYYIDVIEHPKLKVIEHHHMQTNKSLSKVVKKKPMKQKQKPNLLCTGSKLIDTESEIEGALKRKWLYVGEIYGPHVTGDRMKDFLRNSTNTDNFFEQGMRGLDRMDFKNLSVNGSSECCPSET